VVRLPDSEFDDVTGVAGRTELRNAFLTAVSKDSPQTLRELQEDAFAAFCACRRELDRLAFPHTQPLVWFEIAYYEAAAELISALKEWACTWHLEADWCFDNALRTLQSWLTDKNNLRFQTELYVTDVILPLNPPAGLPFYQPGPGGMTQQAYLKWVREEIDNAISSNSILSHAEASQRVALIDSIIEVAKKYCQESEKVLSLPRSVEKTNLQKHIKWSLRFQVKEEKLSEIAEKDGVEESAVSQAVKFILERIDLPSRTQRKRGRPRGSKTRNLRSSKIRRDLGKLS